MVELHGELELATRGLLHALDANVRAGDVRVDAAGVSFVDCSGLGALVEPARSVRATGRGFAITRTSPALARLSQPTGQAELLGITPD